MAIPWLNPHSTEFPPLELALSNPNGLLAVGGDLSPQRLLAAYQQGIFPWYNPGDPILWWSPNPRTVLFPHKLHISKSLRKWLRQGVYRVTFDQCFGKVMQACAAPRAYADGTWINEDIIAGYSALHRQNIAHSVEVWRENELVGGLYGVALGKIFFGESMFSRADNASKIGFTHLVRQLLEWNFQLIDCQVGNPHLISLGAEEIPRAVFQQYLIDFITMEPSQANWSNLVPHAWDSDWIPTIERPL